MTSRKDTLSSSDTTKNSKGMFFILDKIIKSAYLLKWVNSSVLVNGLLKENTRIEQIPAGHDIINEQSDACEHFYILLSGEIRICKVGHEITKIHTISVFGELWFLDPDMNRTCSVIALSDCVVMVFSRMFVEQLDAKNREGIYLNLARAMGKKLSETNEIFIQKWTTAKMSASEIRALKLQKDIF